ncbi:MAG: hypothetical protein DLM52_12435 [Chthoniobacterales bacterium]|nr:MAG: hypothetical protein DLM52_12435 [Chthoniobacterales bacterium]
MQPDRAGAEGANESTRPTAADELLDFLREHDYETLYIAGDLINTWQMRRDLRVYPQSVHQALWPLDYITIAVRRLRKTRYEMRWRNHVVEIDLYRGSNDGIIVAEGEFANEASCRNFKPPPWFGREVTGKKRYSNVRLARE